MPPIDDTLTAEEQAALDADRAAEIEENAAAGAADAGAGTGSPASDADGGEGERAAAATDEQPPARQGMVPHAALHEERTKRQETERQLAEERKARQTLEDRTNLILERFAAPQQQQALPANPAQPEIPPFDQDPAGHILAKQRMQDAILSELVQHVTGQARQNEAATSVQQLTMRAAAMEREFAATNPDYDKASSYLYEARRQELMAGGWSDPAEIQQMLANEVMGLAARAIQQGVNPAHRVYELAKLRGYAPSAPPADQGGSVNNGAAEGQLRTIAAGQQQSRTVGALRGAGPAPMNAARLAELPADEFLEWMKKKEGRDLMGV